MKNLVVGENVKVIGGKWVGHNGVIVKVVNRNDGKSGYKIYREDFGDYIHCLKKFVESSECDEVGGEDLVIFDSEFKYFTEVGTSENVIPTDLVMNLSIHNRGQAIAAIAALQSAYQCNV